MLKDCMKIFFEEYNRPENGEQMILRDYSLSRGNYYFVDYRTGQVIESLEVEDWDLEKTSLYRQFQIRDYLSNLISMNKPMDKYKQIHSNNYLSFFVKKDKLVPASADFEKLERSIHEYYRVLADFKEKYDKAKMAILDNLKLEENDQREEELEQIYHWILSHYKDLAGLDHFKEDKNYLKIFFVDSQEALEEDSLAYKKDIEKYELEAQKYIMPHIYNSNDYNEEIEDGIYGASNNNFGLNAKKPYLMNKTRKTQVPWLVEMEDIAGEKLFFDWLHALSGRKLVNVYIGQTRAEGGFTNVIEAFPSKESLSDFKFTGYYLRIKKSTNEAEIVDLDTVESFPAEEEGVRIVDFLKLPQGLRNDNYYSTTRVSRSQALGILDQALFGNRLMNSFFLEATDVSRDDPILRMGILELRDMLGNWYFKGKSIQELAVLERISWELLVRHLEKNQYPSFVNGYNVRKSFLNNFKKAEEVDEMNEKEMRERLKEKLSSEEIQTLEGDRDFCFALGQLWYYLLYQSEASNKNYGLLLPVLNTKSLKRIKRLTMDLIDAYAHALMLQNRKLNRLISMVSAYEREDFVSKKEWIVAGFAMDNLMLEKGEKKDDK